jgi:hypothetical protein
VLVSDHEKNVNIGTERNTLHHSPTQFILKKGKTATHRRNHAVVAAVEGSIAKSNGGEDEKGENDNRRVGRGEGESVKRSAIPLQRVALSLCSLTSFNLPVQSRILCQCSCNNRKGFLHLPELVHP